MIEIDKVFKQWDEMAAFSPRIAVMKTQVARAESHEQAALMLMVDLMSQEELMVELIEKLKYLESIAPKLFIDAAGRAIRFDAPNELIQPVELTGVFNEQILKKAEADG